jgi:hypothetical protein
MKPLLIIVALALTAVLISITVRSWRREPGITDNPVVPVLMAALTVGIIGAMIGVASQ